MRDATPRFRPDKILRALESHGVRYVVIGNPGAVLHGSTLFTGDLDICPARDHENLARRLPRQSYPARAPGSLNLDRPGHGG